ncbi:hypothetical protein [Leucobacter soli]|uniref:hypothetical protein n=1 Tax=Leucobacter soli TaxID=2812850 RepID=UPI003614FF53
MNAQPPSPATAPEPGVAAAEDRRPASEHRWYRFIGHPTPLLKQLPTAIALLASLILVALLPEMGFDQLGFVVAGSLLVVGATVYAAAQSGERGRARPTGSPCS